MSKCKECKWFQASPFFDPENGECKPPSEDGVTNPGFGGARHIGKWVSGSDEACEIFAMAERGGKYHDVI